MKTSKTGPRLKKPGGEDLLRASPFLLPSLIGLAIFYLAPMVVSIFISLTDWNGLDRLFADGFMQEHFIGLATKISRSVNLDKAFFNAS